MNIVTKYSKLLSQTYNRCLQIVNEKTALIVCENSVYRQKISSNDSKDVIKE